ncbi:MAG: hypothetical protein RL660_1325 [Bacteroidota bacterium]
MVDLNIEYSDKKVTPFGGMVLMKKFIDKIGIVDKLSELDLPISGSNRGYNASTVVQSFWLSIWTGASRYIHCDWLRYDTVLQKIFKFSAMPSQSTYSRFFKKFNLARNTRVFTELQQWTFDQINVNNLTIDFDSTVITHYGNQEGSVRGYNPNKRGRNSHHPLMAFVSETKMVANAWLRPGNTAASTSCVEFMQETFSHCLQGKKIGLVRADSGFYTNDILRYLEQSSINYVIAVRMYPNIKSAIYCQESWIPLARGIDLCDMYFEHDNGVRRRYLLVRKQTSERPLAKGRLLFEELPDYRYSCYVTNIDLPIEQIWNIYNSRADCENRIKELKADFGLDNFCLNDFWATEASFRLIMVAYNLIAMFKIAALQSHKTSTLKTLKLYCFALGSWVSTHANKSTLKISLPQKRRQWMDGIFATISGLNTPFEHSNA